MERSLPNNPSPGLVVLLGSGETSPSARKVYEQLLRRLPPMPRLALLETPAGFELNSTQVIGRVADFMRQRLQNFQPQITIISARQRGTPFSTDDPQIVAPLLEADLIFMGPGSPSYAVRQLKDSLAWYYVLARHRLGTPLVFASAAVVAISAFAIPVYEIYKVGEDLHWKAGLNLFASFDLPLVFIPHWNNNSGGEELDTSRCYIGQSRFEHLMAMLPADFTVLGIDEQTALIMELEASRGQVIGRGGVTLIHTGHHHSPQELTTNAGDLNRVAEQRQGHIHYLPAGESFPLELCCPFRVPPAGAGIPTDVWERAVEAQARLETQRASTPQVSQVPVPARILEILEARQAARQRRDWATADLLREEIASLGWAILDTPEGPKLEKL